MDTFEISEYNTIQYYFFTDVCRNSGASTIDSFLQFGPRCQWF